jgi:plastocyanin
LRRDGRTTLQDALVFVVIALVALVLVEGLILSGASTASRTFTSISATTITDPQPDAISTSTVTVTSDGTSTVTAVSNQTSTLTDTKISTSTSTSTDLLILNMTSTSTSTYNSTDTETTTTTATTTVTTGNTNTSTTTSTTTVTSVVVGPFISIVPGASSNTSSPGFAPDNATVVIGVNNTVTWINDDHAHQTVTSTSVLEPFNSGDLAPNQTFTFTFTQPGTYVYVSAYYPWMDGTIVVRQ